jgi:Fic family protein
VQVGIREACAWKIRFNIEAYWYKIRFMWIWQVKQWPNFQFDARALQPAIASARTAQGRMLGMASQLQVVELSDMQINGMSAEALATAQIEGEVLHPQSVRASAARRLGLLAAKPAKKNSGKPGRKNFKLDHRAPAREEATLDVIEAAVSQWHKPLTEAQLFGWHAMLFPTGYSGITPIPVGAYRTHAESMQIVTPQIGKEDIVHYQAPPSADVPAHMQKLIAWFNQSQDQIDCVVRAAVAHLWLEAIHPFEDGNGRIGRALSDLALAQDAQSSQRLFSLSHQLLERRNEYYEQLEAATAKGSLNVTTWVQWFAQRMQAACEHSVQQIHAALGKTRYWAQVQASHPHLSASQRKVLNKLFDAQPGGFDGGLSTEKYVAITSLSRATAYRELTQLLAARLLVKTGLGKATRYALQI